MIDRRSRTGWSTVGCGFASVVSTETGDNDWGVNEEGAVLIEDGC